MIGKQAGSIRDRSKVSAPGRGGRKALGDRTNTQRNVNDNVPSKLIQKAQAPNAVNMKVHLLHPYPAGISTAVINPPMLAQHPTAVPSYHNIEGASQVEIPDVLASAAVSAPLPDFVPFAGPVATPLVEQLEAPPNELPPMIYEEVEEDFHDPQLVACYAEDIMEHMREVETRLDIGPNHLFIQCDINARIRLILVDWLIQVNSRFQYLQETLFLTVDLLDRYLKKVPVTKQQAQLVGVTAMFIAGKYEEITSMEIIEFALVTDRTYSTSQIRRKEIAMLRTLDFALSKPLPLQFLRRYSKAAYVTFEVHALAKYILEIAIHDAEMVQFKPSLVAATALYVSLILHHDARQGIFVPPFPSWTELLVYHSKLTEHELRKPVSRICFFIRTRLYNSQSNKPWAIKKKYSSEAFSNSHKFLKNNCHFLDYFSNCWILADIAHQAAEVAAQKALTPGGGSVAEKAVDHVEKVFEATEAATQEALAARAAPADEVVFDADDLVAFKAAEAQIERICAKQEALEAAKVEKVRVEALQAAAAAPGRVNVHEGAVLRRGCRGGTVGSGVVPVGLKHGASADCTSSVPADRDGAHDSVRGRSGAHGVVRGRGGAHGAVRGRGGAHGAVRGRFGASMVSGRGAPAGRGGGRGR